MKTLKYDTIKLLMAATLIFSLATCDKENDVQPSMEMSAPQVQPDPLQTAQEEAEALHRPAPHPLPGALHRRLRFL